MAESLVNGPLQVNEDEVQTSAIRAQGAGGQNVNKVSSAIHLRFDIKLSSLPDEIKERLLALADGRITRAGVVIIKAQQHRTQEMNRMAAMQRLQDLVDSVAQAPKPRRPTQPSYGAKQRLRSAKIQRSETKVLRGRVHE